MAGETAVPLAGGCLCGAVRYRISPPLRNVVYCHCRMCQRSGGAPVVPWITVRAEGFVLERGAPVVYASSPKAERSFCGTCGTPLTFRYVKAPRWIDVTLASLDDPGMVPPRAHIWTSSRMPWLHIDDELPRHPEASPRSTDPGAGT
ncbi:MAG TPA: GFA family protein [Candidatus Cybelea sp.]|nr:GFA family protein [Candidatus Cybelea sp.]